MSEERRKAAAAAEAAASSCCHMRDSDEDNNFDTCSSGDDNHAESEPGISAIVTVNGACTSKEDDSATRSEPGDIDRVDYYLPPEHMASDDSDTAGVFCVNAESDENSREPYQRLNLFGEESIDTDDSDEDEEDPLERLMRVGHHDSSSSSNSDENDDDDLDDDSILKVGSVKVKHNLFRSFQQRLTDNILLEIAVTLYNQAKELGSYANRYNVESYVQGMMGNLKFVQRLECVEKLDQHEGCVNSLSFNQSGTLLASGSDDLKCILWDMSTYRPYLSFETGHRANVFQSKFMPYSNDSQVVTCARDGQVRLAELSTTGSCRGTRKLATHKDSAHKLAMELDSPHCLLSAGEDGMVFQIDLRQPKPIKLVQCRNGVKKLPLHSIDKNPVHFNEFLVSGKDHFIRIYDKRHLPMQTTAENDGVLKKFYPHKFEQDSPFQRDITSAVYNFDGSEIVATYNDDDIYLFKNDHSDGADKTNSYTGHRNNATVKGVNFYGPKSEYIVSGSDCGNVFMWDKESGQVILLQKGDDGGVVNVLEPHPYYPYLATSGLDNDIKLFMPVAEQPVNLESHVKLMNRNVRQRDTHQREEINGQLLWLIMQQLRRARRRRMRDASQQADSSDDESSDEEEDEDSSDRPERSNTIPNCVTS